MGRVVVLSNGESADPRGFFSELVSSRLVVVRRETLRADDRRNVSRSRSSLSICLYGILYTVNSWVFVSKYYGYALIFLLGTE